jgi:amphi-Trp domain-containing protein
MWIQTLKTGQSEGSAVIGKKFEQEFYMTSDEAVKMLRGLADELESHGKVEASSGEWTLAVIPTEPMKVEVQFKHDPMKRELEFQLKLKGNP